MLSEEIDAFIKSGCLLKRLSIKCKPSLFALDYKMSFSNETYVSWGAEDSLFDSKVWWKSKLIIRLFVFLEINQCFFLFTIFQFWKWKGIQLHCKKCVLFCVHFVTNGQNITQKFFEKEKNTFMKMIKK